MMGKDWSWEWCNVLIDVPVVIKPRRKKAKKKPAKRAKRGVRK